MTDQEFDAIRKLLLERSGIALDRGKEYLVESRLAPLMKKLNLGSIGELTDHLRRQTDNGIPKQIVEAMVTTESLFFRDHHPFEALRQSVIPDLMNKRRQDRCLNIWCAACSTGQEPYSVALTLREHFPELAGWKITFLASDISEQVLARAREGRYSQIEVNRGLPASLMIKHFEQHGTHWQLKSGIRSMIDFREINLSSAWPFLPQMDLILVRNVMIYFEVETKKAILNKVARLLRRDGYLFLGGAETTFGLDESFRRVEPIKAGIYQLVS